MAFVYPDFRSTGFFYPGSELLILPLLQVITADLAPAPLLTEIEFPECVVETDTKGPEQNGKV